MRRYISDTGPLLHLHEANALGVLKALGEIRITPCVRHEIARLATDWQKQDWPQCDTPSATALASARDWVQAGLLHAGEAEALAYAREIRPDAFLTDDTEAREMAVALGLEARGSLGVILLAAARRLIGEDEAISALERLMNDSTLWLSKRVRREARAALDRILQAR